MKKNKRRSLLAAIGLIACMPVDASMVSYDLTRSSLAPPLLPDGETYLTVTIADAVDATLGDVTFTIDVMTTGSLQPDPGSKKGFGIEKFWFNDASVMNDLVTLESQFNLSGASGWEAKIASPALALDGSVFGLFDLGVKGKAGVETLTFGLSGAGLSIESFNELSQGNVDSLFAAKVKGFLDVDPGAGNVTSAWFGTGSTVSVVPIPAAAWLFASGIGLLGLFGHRQRRAAVASLRRTSSVRKAAVTRVLSISIDVSRSAIRRV